MSIFDWIKTKSEEQTRTARERVAKKACTDCAETGRQSALLDGMGATTPPHASFTKDEEELGSKTDDPGRRARGETMAMAKRGGKETRKKTELGY